MLSGTLYFQAQDMLHLRHSSPPALAVYMLPLAPMVLLMELVYEFLSLEEPDEGQRLFISSHHYKY